MERFLKRHEGRIKGIISGFDRVLFRGTLRSIAYSEGIEKWLWSEGVRLTEFAPFAERVSTRLKENAKAIAAKHGRPYEHIQSPKASKEEIARRTIEKEKIARGLVCVLSCVEPSRTFAIQKDRHAKMLRLVATERPCLHLYFYYVDREFGLMHVRLQTWLPFTIQICINGWEFLANRLDQVGIRYEKRDNCFVHIGDLPKAQRLIDSLIDRKWVPWFDLHARTVNPWIDPRNGLHLRGYYWTIRQGEYSTDVIFNDRDTLKAVFPYLLNHAIQHLGSNDILRFLQRRTNTRFSGEIKTELKHRIEGVRVKHMVEENSIKMYDKQGSVLRIETTINNPRRWSVWRRATRRGQRVMAWIPMRKGIADIRKRAEVARAANERYLEALSVVGDTLPSRQVLDPISRRVTRNGRSYRPLRPISPEDVKILRVIAHGSFLLKGFRNQDLRTALYPEAGGSSLAREQCSGRVSRMLRLLRSHGLIAKLSRSHSYRVTSKGRQVTTIATTLREQNVLGFAA
jgi:hypothetical protein